MRYSILTTVLLDTTAQQSESGDTPAQIAPTSPTKMTEKEDPYHLSGKPLPTTRIAPTNYTETATFTHLDRECVARQVGVPAGVQGAISEVCDHLVEFFRHA